MDNIGVVSGCKLMEQWFYYSCRIFAGYNKAVRVFDIHRPGRDFEQHSTLQGNKEGLAGTCS